MADVLLMENLSLEELRPSGPILKAIGKLIAARQLSGHPITVSQWDGARRLIVGWFLINA